MNMDDATNGTVGAYTFYPDYFKVVPIERGDDKPKWKAPQFRGWNTDSMVARYSNALPDGYNGGLCHKQSGTCAIDIDNLRTSTVMFAERGLNLTALLATGVQIVSGRDNRAKLIYRLPTFDLLMEDYPPLKQIADDSGMIMEFRCVYGSTGNTCQDVLPPSIHPDTNEQYKWATQRSSPDEPLDIPEIPAPLLAWWRELATSSEVRETDSNWQGIADTPEEREKVARALRVLSPDLPYPEWRNVGVALHDTGWDDAYDLWDEWSSQGVSYRGPEETWDKWHGMGHGRGIKLSWLYAQAYEQDRNWDRPTLDDMFGRIQPETGPATIDGDTGQMVHDLHSILSQVDEESDANVMEWACQHIVLQANNRAEQSDWLHILADRSRYNLTTLGPMLSQARREMSRQQNSAGAVLAFPHVNDAENPLPTRANAEVIANHYGFQFYFNLMTRKVETERDLNNVPADVRELSHLTDYEDLCVQHRMDDKRVQKHRDRMAFENSYHPFVQYLETEEMINGPYDSEREPDYILELASSLNVDHDKRHTRNILLKRWLVSAVAAAHMKDESEYEPWETKPKAPRGVLVLQGPQNIGKTSWFDHLTPDGMYKEGLQMNLNDMNHMKTATNRLIVEIGEADHATKGRMANYMKTIIGRDVDEVRLAFQREEVRMVRRNVFCATVNPAEFLSDDQNTRWWTINIDSIDFAQSDSVDIKRLWQQVYHLWKSGENYHLTPEEMDELNQSNEKFRAISYFESWLLDTYDFEDMEGQDNPANWCTTKEILLRYGDKPDVSQSEVRSILARLTNHPNVLASVGGKKGRFWRLPALLE